MKKAILLGVILTMGLFVPQAYSQVIVKVRPNRPALVVKKPARAKRGHVWRDGHWVYNNKQGKYVWRKGTWVKSRPGKVWVKGHWKTVPSGQKWIPGHWR